MCLTINVKFPMTLLRMRRRRKWKMIGWSFTGSERWLDEICFLPSLSLSVLAVLAGSDRNLWLALINHKINNQYNEIYFICGFGFTFFWELVGWGWGDPIYYPLFPTPVECVCVCVSQWVSERERERASQKQVKSYWGRHYLSCLPPAGYHRPLAWCICNVSQIV